MVVFKMLPSPFAAAKRKMTTTGANSPPAARQREQQRGSGLNNKDNIEGQTIVAALADPAQEESLEFDALSSCSAGSRADSEEEQEEFEVDDSDDDDDEQNNHEGDGGSSLHNNSVSSFSSSLSSSLHSSSSRFMDSVRNINFLPRRMKPTLEKYNELPDESGGNSSVELARELDKIGTNDGDDAPHDGEVEPSDPHLITNLEEVMALEGDNDDDSIVLDHHRDGTCQGLSLSPSSPGRPVVDVPPPLLSPVRRASRRKPAGRVSKRFAASTTSKQQQQQQRDEEKTVEEDKTTTSRAPQTPQPGVRRGQPLSKDKATLTMVPHTPQRGVRRGQPLSAVSQRKKVDSSAVAMMHQSMPAFLDHSLHTAVKEAGVDSPRCLNRNVAVEPHHHGGASAAAITTSRTNRRLDRHPSRHRSVSSNKSNSVSPRRRYRYPQQPQQHHHSCAAGPQPSPNLAPTTPTVMVRNTSRRRNMNLIQAPDLISAGGRVVGGAAATLPGGGLSQDSMIQRSISTDSTDLGRIARRSSTTTPSSSFLSGINQANHPSQLNASLGTLKTDFLGKTKPQRERTKFDFDPKSLKDVTLPAKKTPASSSSAADKRRVSINPVIALHHQSSLGI
jgi:hypothetical protein